MIFYVNINLSLEFVHSGISSTIEFIEHRPELTIVQNKNTHNIK
jgi:hypothetical protein